MSQVDTYKPHMTFATFQREVSQWVDHNFGGKAADPLAVERQVFHNFLGVVEEVGELSHSLLKQSQGIRGTFDEHEAKAKDAVGDIVTFLVNVCNRKGWSLQQIVEEMWAEVKARDWVKYPTTGRPPV